MKKLAASLLTMIFLLNVVGYYGVFLGFRHSNNLRMSHLLDAAFYDSGQTFEIKIALTVPYATNQEGFERVRGQFEHNGEYYQMVKQRLANDTLTVICLKDNRQKTIQHAMVDFVKTFTDSSSPKAANAKFVPILIKDYLQQAFAVKNETHGWESSIDGTPVISSLVATFSSSIVHPPERA